MKTKAAASLSGGRGNSPCVSSGTAYPWLCSLRLRESDLFLDTVHGDFRHNSASKHINIKTKLLCGAVTCGKTGRTQWAESTSVSHPCTHSLCSTLLWSCRSPVALVFAAAASCSCGEWQETPTRQQILQLCSFPTLPATWGPAQLISASPAACVLPSWSLCTGISVCR